MDHHGWYKNCVWTLFVAAHYLDQCASDLVATYLDEMGRSYLSLS